MSYHRAQGDYYPGGAQGDWASIWKGVKTVGGQVLGGLLGGWAAGQTGGTYVPPGPIMVPPTFPQPRAGVGTPPIIGGAVTFPGGASFTGQVMLPGQGRLPPFTATGPGVLPAGGRGGQMIPSGYHFAKDGSGRLVRNRRMNIANPRALRRAMRRVQGFEKLARRTITFTRRVKMKKRKS